MLGAAVGDGGDLRLTVSFEGEGWSKLITHLASGVDIGVPLGLVPQVDLDSFEGETCLRKRDFSLQGRQSLALAISNKAHVRDARKGRSVAAVNTAFQRGDLIDVPSQCKG